MYKRIKSILTVALFTLVVLSSLINGLAEETYSWEEKANMSVGRIMHNTIEADGNIYVIGGRTSSYNYLRNMDVYNPASNTWEPKANMLTSRRASGAAKYNGKIYVFGGYVDGNDNSSSVEAYDIATNTWEAKTDMPTGRSELQAITVGDKIYVIGGKSSKDIVEVYSPNTDTWEAGVPMPVGRQGFGITKIGSKIYVIGGITSNSSGMADDDTLVFDTISNTWEVKANMITPRDRFGVASVGTKIYIIGGYEGTSQPRTTDVYDSVSNTWNTVAQAPSTALRDISCSSIGNRIYIPGGYIFPNYQNKLIVFTVAEEVSIPSSPTNLTATPANAQITLNWNAVDGAESYNIKRSTTQGGPYTTIADNVTSTTYVDTNVTNGTTYYYVVTAVKAGSESENSNEASATPVAPVINRALLHITMQNGFIKEYDMAMTDVDSFISWYNSTSGSNLYTINKHNNIGPFLNRIDYLVKDKIMYFEVMEYDSQN